MFAYRLRDSLVLGVKWKQIYTKAVSTEKKTNKKIEQERRAKLRTTWKRGMQWIRFPER